MIDCREATHLNAARFERPLHWRQRIALGLHLLLCPPCRFYRRQMLVLRRAARRLAGEDASGSAVRLADDARERLRRRLREGRRET